MWKCNRNSLSLLLAALMLAGCAGKVSQPVATLPEIPYSPLLETANTPVPSLADIFVLTQAQQTEFLTYYNAPSRQHIAGHRRIYRFLSEHFSGFNYQGKNYTATQAFALKSGNCITLAVLTKALADIVGVDVKFQTIVSAPLYSIENDFMLSSDHVRTFVYAPDFTPEKNTIYFSTPGIVIDYMPAAGDMTGPRISHSTFVAMFYRNLAADAILSGQYAQALALLRTALNYAPTYGAAINLVAVIHRRLQQESLAEQFYLYGLNVADSKATLIGNYAVLKQSVGEPEVATQLLQSLQALDEHDPYLWYSLGLNAAKAEQYQQAIAFFKKAAAQAPYLHQFQFELALAYFNNNQPGLAYSSLTKAAELSAATEQQRYYAKLEALALRR